MTESIDAIYRRSGFNVTDVSIPKDVSRVPGSRLPVGSGSHPVRGAGPIRRWLLDGQTRGRTPAGPYESANTEKQHAWWRVVCLTGVDYFSSIGYAPGIAALAAGVVSPIATLVLVIVTLFGALQMYKHVADESPHGDGSVSMLERLLPWWQGKLFVLCLIGFVTTGFVITITLSAADAAAHLVENPLLQPLRGDQMAATLILIALLGAVFLRGFSEAIGIAVVLVAVYLTLNVVVIAEGFRQIAQHPALVGHWRDALMHAHGNPLALAGAALLVFPKLALGLSGFETGVLVMPLIRGDRGDDPRHPVGRIRNARKLLTAAAAIMSVLLLTSSFVTTLLIPPQDFQSGGAASGRALAFVAHRYLGDAFGSAYDVSTICILWFAGASAMAGLLNIVPRYLPRYGMAPDWTRATRPLAILVTLIAVVVTILFRASVDGQAGAYATGVLAIMTSATIAVTLSMRRKRKMAALAYFSVVSIVFIYTFGNTIVSQPTGIKIAATFIVAIVVVSLVSRIWRSTELRVTSVEVDGAARRFIEDAGRSTVRLIANHPDDRSPREYLLKEREQRTDNHIPPGEPVLFLEVKVCDASDFEEVVHVHGEEIEGHRVLRVESAAIPNAIAAVLLYIRDITDKRPHVYFGWSEGNPLKYLAYYILFGEGDIAPVTHEVLRQAEPKRDRRPAIHVG
ncbi:MAG: amino acid transporter [Chloroflexota bacterium]